MWTKNKLTADSQSWESTLVCVPCVSFLCKSLPWQNRKPGELRWVAWGLTDFQHDKWGLTIEQISKTFWAFEKVMNGWSIKIFGHVRSLCIRKSSTTTWQVQLPTKQHLNSRRTQEWRKLSEPKRSQCRSLMSHWWHASLLGAARDSADDGLASCFGFLISTSNSF